MLKTSPQYVASFNDSAHAIYWPTKGLKKSLEQFIDQMKKAKKGLENWLMKNDNSESRQM